MFVISYIILNKTCHLSCLPVIIVFDNFNYTMFRKMHIKGYVLVILILPNIKAFY